MQPQRWQDKQITFGRLLRLFLISATILLILLAGVVWILNLGGVSWSIPLATFFIVLGVLFAFLQWAVPRSPLGSQTSVASYEQMATLPADDKAYNIFIENERDKLYNNPNPKSMGTLVVRGDKSLLGEEVKIGGQPTFINQYTIDGRPIYLATLTKLIPNNYKVEMRWRQSIWVAIHPRQVSEVDWRPGDKIK